MKKIKFQEKGQALIVVALAMVVLFGFAALAIDGSRVFSDRRNAQNAADTAVMAAALAKVKTDKGIPGPTYKTAATDRATSNNYTNGINGATVTVNLCSDSGVTCTGLPAGANRSEYIRVGIKSVVPMTFAKILGWVTIPNNVEAIARAQTHPPITNTIDQALAACSKTGTAFAGKGNGTLEVVGSGIFSNSTTSSCPNGAMKLGGSITYTVGSYNSPGSVCSVGGNTLNGPINTANQIDCSTLYNYSPPSITCSVPGQLIGNQYQPGNYNGISGLTPPYGNYSFAPGNYCITGNVNINGGNITANDANFLLSSGSFSINGNSTFTCNNVVFYSAGGTGVSFNGAGVNTCTNVTFYMATGGMSVNGTSDNIFKAPTSGAYEGLLVYLPYGNSSAININGNSGSQIYGSIIAVSSPVTISGNNNSTGLHTQIVSDTIDFSGNGTTKIIFDTHVPSPPPDSPIIQLTK